MAVIGVVMFGVGVHSKGKLDHVRALLKDESVVRAAFNTVDIEGDNALTAEELGMLCTNLGSTLEPNELEVTSGPRVGSPWCIVSGSAPPSSPTNSR